MLSQDYISENLVSTDLVRYFLSITQSILPINGYVPIFKLKPLNHKKDNSKVIKSYFISLRSSNHHIDNRNTYRSN